MFAVMPSENAKDGVCTTLEVARQLGLAVRLDRRRYRRQTVELNHIEFAVQTADQHNHRFAQQGMVVHNKNAHGSPSVRKGC